MTAISIHVIGLLYSLFLLLSVEVIFLLSPLLLIVLIADELLISTARMVTLLPYDFYPTLHYLLSPVLRGCSGGSLASLGLHHRSWLLSLPGIHTSVGRPFVLDWRHVVGMSEGAGSKGVRISALVRSSCRGAPDWGRGGAMV